MAKKSISVSRYKRTIKSISTATNKQRRKVSQRRTLARKTRFKAQEVNKYLKNLQKWGHYNSWASKSLIDMLSSSKLNIINASTGLIDVNRITPEFGTTSLTAINKSINKFLNSKTKTIQGINGSIRKKRSDLIEKSDNPQWVKTLSNKEVETLYKVFDDETYKSLSEKVRYEQIWNTIIEASKSQYTKEDFQEELSLYVDSRHMNDVDILGEMAEIYDKFVSLK